MNLNKAIIVGRITNNPESRATNTGNAISHFSLATNRVWTDQSGQKQEMPEFHNIVAFGRLAEICNQYLTKGQIVLIEGRIQTRSWDDQNGVKKYRTEIIAENMQMGPRAQGTTGDFGRKAAKPANKEAVIQQEPVAPVEPGVEEEEFKVEDIPF